MGVTQAGNSLMRKSSKQNTQVVTEGAENNVELYSVGTPEISIQRAELRKVDTSGFSAGQKGSYGERMTQVTMQRAGYSELPARLSRNNGFDGVWIKYNTDGSIKDIIITETKFSSSSRASMSETIKMGKQMSDEWIDVNIQKMIESKDIEVRRTGRILDMYEGEFTKKAALVTPDGNQRFNKIKIPEN